MKIKFFFHRAGALLFLLPLSTFGQGSLTPPGAPAPTMKSLDQIEARTAITNTAKNGSVQHFDTSMAKGSENR